MKLKDTLPEIGGDDRTLVLKEQQRQHKAKVDQEARRILEEKELPACGEVKSWTNDDLSDVEPEDLKHPTLKILSWNIERGLKLEGQLEYLKQVDADILCLQELDWGCMRTDERNITAEIADKLGYKYVTYATEFVELDSKDDSEHLQAFPKSKRISLKKIGRGGGVHGHAILSKFPIKNSESIKLTNAFFDWEDAQYSMSQFEPRQGQRVSQKARIKIGNREITVYNTHLENNYGTTGRLAQYDEVANDAEGERNPCVITGDFNTLSHGIAQVLPGMRKDMFSRIRRLFQSDAEHWYAMEFSNTPLRRQLEEGVINPRKKSFSDPSGPKQATLNIGPIYKAKLDWTLFEDKRFEVKQSETGPSGLSDHRPLIATVQIV